VSLNNNITVNFSKPLNFYSLRLAFPTTSFNIQKLRVLPTMHFFFVDLRTAIISLYSIKLSVFMNKAQGVYYAIRTGSLNRTETVWSLKG